MVTEKLYCYGCEKERIIELDEEDIDSEYEFKYCYICRRKLHPNNIAELKKKIKQIDEEQKEIPGIYENSKQGYLKEIERLKNGQEYLKEMKRLNGKKTKTKNRKKK